MFSAILVELKAEGKGAVRHKDPLTGDDLVKLYTSFDMATPLGLQNKVFVDLMLHMCNRGRENIRSFKAEYFTVTTDSTGLRYIFMNQDMKTKNHQGRSSSDLNVIREFKIDFRNANFNPRFRNV